MSVLQTHVSIMEQLSELSGEGTLSLNFSDPW